MASDYTDYLVDVLASWDRVTAKAMFGGYGLYRRGIIFSIVDDDRVFFKVNDSNRPDYEAAGMGPFTYDAKGGKKVAMSYWQVPLSVLEDADTLAEWAEKAYGAAITAKKPKKKR